MSSRVKIGLEIHVQLGGRKLFCECPTENSGNVRGSFTRRLSLSSGELGNFDPAAVYEKVRARVFSYDITANSCLVEFDEEPPHRLNEEALIKGLAVSMSLDCKTVDVVEYMRKIVVDGSNTSGFQRTAIISFGGEVKTSRGPVRISTICLEEDSARKETEEGETVRYSLDRLGTPLLEIATEPDIEDEDHATETAEKIGQIILISGWARKSPDAIRQDVNFSMGFGRVEIKGVPKLSLIGECLKFEKERQESLSEISQCIGRQWGDEILFRDVTDLFSRTESKVISSSLKNGKRVYASSLPGLKGYLKKGKYRLGRELADVAKLFGSGGVMHSDELPAFGVRDELPVLRELLKVSDGDGFLIIVSTDRVVWKIQEAMNIRMRKLLSMDLSETRYVTQDGETHFLRPLPGGERMYPETDVPLYHINEQTLLAARKIKPRSKDQIEEELVKTYGISEQDASIITSGGIADTFQAYAKASGSGKLAARIILQTLPEIEKKTGKKANHERIIDLISSIPVKDRSVVETAIEMLEVRNMNKEDILNSDEIIPMGEEELRREIISLLENGEIGEKNLIPALRKKTTKLFDPSLAFKIFKNISKVQK